MTRSNGDPADQGAGVDPPDQGAGLDSADQGAGLDQPERDARLGRAAGLDPADRSAVAAQLGRAPRGARAVAHRCPCGLPDVVETAPRLADGTPFPTLYYLTCPRAATAVSTLESAGAMRDMSARLATDPELARRYRMAHERYLARREMIGEVPEIAGISAGGMPNRVKCLHVQLAQALAEGSGVNPFGDETLELIPPWWAGGPCVPAPSVPAPSVPAPSVPAPSGS